jgi:hypothetical protein
MPCLLDTSIVNALAQYRLLDEALLVQKVQPADLLILPELHYQLESNTNSRGQPILDPNSLGVARKFCASLQRIKSSPDESNDRFLLNKRNDDIWHEARRVKIDGGEANLFAATKNLNQFSIWTADKKCLIALSKWPKCEHIHQRIVGHVLCLERIIRNLIEVHGFNAIAPKVAKGYHAVDGAIALGDAECCNKLREHETQLQQGCNGLLAA